MAAHVSSPCVWPGAQIERAAIHSVGCMLRLRRDISPWRFRGRQGELLFQNSKMIRAIETTECAAPSASKRGWPMLPIRAVVARLNKNEDQVLELIEGGQLLWAFDVSLQPSRCRCKELRVLPECVEDFEAGRECRLVWGDVIRILLPHDGIALWTAEVARLLNASGTHVIALVRRGELQACSSNWSRGPGNGASITAESLKVFLRHRRYPALPDDD